MGLISVNDDNIERIISESKKNIILVYIWSQHDVFQAMVYPVIRKCTYF
ncbi:MAG: hypothetical protein ACXAC7_09705 [Candidatus Hodarchaeales archaeon]